MIAPPGFLSVFLGMLGPNGPLPLHITEYARQRLRNYKDKTLASFLDIFNHRMISLFYRAWACNQQTVSYDNSEGDCYSRYIGSLFGMGMQSLRDRDAVVDVAKLYYSGHLVCPTRHAAGLAALLADFFGVPVEIDQFVGQWMELPVESRCRLGDSPATGMLGSTAIVGSRMWQCQQKFRIRFGPVGLDALERMLPGGQSLERMIAWVRNYVGDALEWDLQLILKREEVPKIIPGRAGRLGWSTWLRSKPFKKDADDVVLRPSAA